MSSQHRNSGNYPYYIFAGPRVSYQKRTAKGRQIQNRYKAYTKSAVPHPDRQWTGSFRSPTRAGILNIFLCLLYPYHKGST